MLDYLGLRNLILRLSQAMSPPSIAEALRKASVKSGAVSSNSRRQVADPLGPVAMTTNFRSPP